MRGDTERQADIMLAVTPGSFVPAGHPIRRIKPIVDAALARLSPLFDSTYSTRGGPSIPPEHLLKASLLIALYPVCSEGQFCEGLRYGLLFKWFLDLNIADEPFDASTFSKKRERLLSKEVAVSPGKATLRYTIPMPQDSPIAGQDSEQLILPRAVLPTVRLGRPTRTVLRTFRWRVLIGGPSSLPGLPAKA